MKPPSITIEKDGIRMDVVRSENDNYYKLRITQSFINLNEKPKHKTINLRTDELDNFKQMFNRCYRYINGK